jgi:uncharacterized protein YndB with AHSA1/START domain
MLNIEVPIINTECEIVTVRTVNFSAEQVFNAWSDPEHLKNWWGPNGFTNTFQDFEFRPGGKWKFVMHGPEQGHYNNECEFIRIEKPFLIHWKRHSKPLFQVLVTFEEISSGKTKVVFRMIFDSMEECNKIKWVAVDKNEENFDRLEVELQKMINKK